MGQRPVGIGARQQHEHVGPGGEGAPGLDAVDDPPALDRRRRGHDPGHVGPVVGLGHGHGGEDLGRGQLGEPVLLLLLGAPVHQRTGQDLGPGDERPAHAERAPAQLLGGDDHPHVVALAARGEAAVLLWHRQPEAAQLGQTLDHLLGDVGVLAVHVLRVRPHLVLGEAVERLADELEVLARGGGGPRSGPARPARRDPAAPAGSRPPARPSRSRPPTAPRARPPCRRGRPRRRRRRRRRSGPRAPRARRRRGRPAPCRPRRPRAPRRRRPPGWRRCPRARAPRRTPGRRGARPGRPPLRRRRAGLRWAWSRGATLPARPSAPLPPRTVA